MASKLVEHAKKFKGGTAVKFILGRGHKYIGKVKRAAKDGYLFIAYTDRFGEKLERRINPDNVQRVRA